VRRHSLAAVNAGVVGVKGSNTHRTARRSDDLQETGHAPLVCIVSVGRSSASFSGRIEHPVKAALSSKARRCSEGYDLIT
jgi:hypothetical protein